MRIIKWSSGKCSSVCFSCSFRCLLVKIHLPLMKAFALAKQSSSFATCSLQINIVTFVKYGLLLEERHGFEAHAILFHFTLELYSWEVMLNQEVVRAPMLYSQDNHWCIISLTYWIFMSFDFPISNHKW